ncbi:anthrone oxygenase family protein [Umezawaea endophytica]|uniref:DUF1772 domain-containing protein n=1 Tax=Umezawaea endophytica TaxID=1654476 RepID=A0A9X3AJ59_9PSEU|nr:DUF1772 domain-containing protein [Umezawaea endophytica]MCS7484112.1 DUF1772 domain-containing protein [Umezawaea endophytica]
MLQILLPLALLCNGLTAGALLIAMIGVAPLRLALPDDRSVQVHQLLLPKVEPWMPALLVGGTIFTGAAGFFAGSTLVHVLTIISSSLQLKAILIALTKNVPINRWLAKLDPEALPPDFAESRAMERWRNWNAARAVMVILSLVINVYVVGLLV